METEAEPPPELVLWELGLEAGSEVDVLLELLVVLELLELLVVLPPVCEPVLVVPPVVVDVDAEAVLGASDGMHGT